MPKARVLPILLFIIYTTVNSSIIQPSEPKDQTISQIQNNIRKVISLVRNNVYKIELTENSQLPYLTTFMTFAYSNSNCSGYMCYYGYIHNFTFQGKVSNGYQQAAGINNPVFKMVTYSNKTFSVIRNAKLDPLVLSILKLCEQLLNPLFAQISNLNPNNIPGKGVQPVYQFSSLKELTKTSQSVKILQNLGNVTCLQNSKLSAFCEVTSIGWNQTQMNSTTTLLDIIVIDNSTNNVLQRLVQLQSNDKKSGKNVTIAVTLQEYSSFTDLTAIYKNIQSIESIPLNIVWFTMFPQTIQLSLNSINFPQQ